MKILATSDWHLDMGNLAFTLPALAEGFRAARERGDIDIFVHAGDLVVNRSNVHPHVAFEVRRHVGFGCALADLGGLIIAGNHDQSFQADRVGMVEGILAAEHDRSLAFNTAVSGLQMATTPRSFQYFYDPATTGDSHITIVAIPTPNKYWAKAHMEAGRDVAGMLQLGVQGLIAAARERNGCRRVLVVYHGTVSGAMLSDEVVMPSGVDVAIPHEAFAGADLVIAGHIHHRQVIEGSRGLPAIYYCGSPAPLNWGERKHKPAMLVIDTETLDVECLHLPVVSQMISIDLAVEAGQPLRQAVDEAVTAAAGKGDRVRVCLRGPQAALDLLDRGLDDEIRQQHGLLTCKITSERTDTAVARAEMSTTTSILDAVARWAAIKELDSQTTDAVLELAREIESQVADKHLDASYEMKPGRLRVSNWCQYAEAEIDFGRLAGLVVTEGPNYSGKSNISRAVAFALYKLQMAGNRLEDLIRKGEDRMTVELDFEARGRGYRIIREVKRTARGATASLHFLDVTDLNNPLPLAEGNARETQEAIDRIIGPAELFLATSFAGQNAVDALLDLSPSELKDLLMQVLQRDFAARLKAGTARRLAAAAQSNETRAKISALSESIAQRDDPSIIGSLQGKLQARQADLQNQEQAAEKLELELGLIRDARDKANHEAEAAGAVIRQINEVTTKLDRGMVRRRELEAKLQAADNILAGFPGGPPVVPRTSEELLAEQRDTVARDRARAESLAVAAAKANDELQAAKANHSELERAAERAHTAASIGARALKEAEQTSALIDGVPCGGLMINVAAVGPPAIIDCGKCQFLARAVAARDNLPDMRRAAEAAQTALDEAVRRTEAARPAIAEKAGAAADLAAEVREFREAAELKAEALRHLVASTLQMERQIADYNQARERKQELAADLQATTEAIATLEAEIAGYRETAGRRTEIMERATVLGVQFDASARMLEQGKVEMAATRRDATTLAGSLEAARQRAADVANDKAAVEGLKADVEILDKRAAIAALYCEAVHRDGIPFILLEQFSIPLLQQATNVYLNRTNLAVQIESEHELQSGELRNSVEITFTDHRGRHPVSVASGAQRSSIGSALRHGMAELLARGTGSNIWLAVQDEGFGTLDAENLEIAKTTLRNIAATRGTFMVISHVPGMSEVADHVLRVVDDGGTSRLEVL